MVPRKIEKKEMTIKLDVRILHYIILQILIQKKQVKTTLSKHKTKN